MKKTFSIEDRAQLRAALLSYMEDHRIGVPTLLARIAIATDRSTDLIPQKTLQRFLAGASRTHDGALVPYAQFASGLPPPAPRKIDSDFLDAFGMDRLPGPAQGEKASNAVLGHLSGTWRVHSELWEGGLKVQKRGDASVRQYVVPFSDCSFCARAGGGSMQVREEVFNPAQAHPFDAAGAGTRHLYEGIALSFDPLIFILARNVLTRLPCTYWLGEFGGEFQLAGDRIEATFDEDRSAPRPYTRQTFTFKRAATETAL